MYCRPTLKQDSRHVYIFLQLFLFLFFWEKSLYICNSLIYIQGFPCLECHMNLLGVIFGIGDIGDGRMEIFN